MKIDAWNFDVGVEAASAEDYASQCLACVEQSWDEGADLVLLPEYCWMGLEPLVEGGPQGVAEWFWGKWWPEHKSRLMIPSKAAVLGTVPFSPGDGMMLNRAPIVSDGWELHQDKMALTPWEDQFTGGRELKLWEFSGLKVAVLVCLDIEVPEWAVMLRESKVDLILVPSATETMMGVERINRCASARAVELGCAVVVAHLIGTSRSSLIDDNLGCTAMYLPSQSAFASMERVHQAATRTKGTFRETFELNPALLSQCRLAMQETNPAQLHKGALAGRLLVNLRHTTHT